MPAQGAVPALLLLPHYFWDGMTLTATDSLGYHCLVTYKNTVKMALTLMFTKQSLTEKIIPGASC